MISGFKTAVTVQPWKEAFNDGMRAYREGRPITENPYGDGWYRDSFRAGWFAQEDQYRREQSL